MTKFSNMFNVNASPTSTKQDRAIAGAEYKIESADRSCRNRAREIRAVVNCVSNGADLTAQVSGNGYNLNVHRLKGETIKEWAARTDEVAKDIVLTSNGGLGVKNSTKGLVIIEVLDPESNAAIALEDLEQNVVGLVVLLEEQRNIICSNQERVIHENIVEQSVGLN